MPAVNVTCFQCDGRRLCAKCRAAGKLIESAGYQVVHSTRYDALKAAIAGTYAFESCIIPVAADEHAIVDASFALLADKRVAIVTDELPAKDAVPPHFKLLASKEYEHGAGVLDWLAGAPQPAAHASVHRETDDRTRAASRLATVVNGAACESREPLQTTLDFPSIIQDEAAWTEASGVGFSIVLLRAADGDAVSRRQRAQTAAQAIREVLRRGDVVAVAGEDVLIVLPQAHEPETVRALGRIEPAVLHCAPQQGKRTPGGRFRIGIASCPGDGLSPVVLLATADAGLRGLRSRAPVSKGSSS
ncbi:MAG: diguanylate cyclase [Candidatus Eremiobacteraeota bacterium]|nr:diguanylate cyclase [Candidatus Eremiobacteraeota bacterium]MBC5826761.1 diguanylate cyclase [Candidatus Eremiobacteraeota bacterium]